jgi:putative ABC transport system permease protein
VTPIILHPADLAVAALLLVADGLLSVALGLGVHRRLMIAGARMVVQLVLVGFILRLVFSLASPALTLVLVVVMALIATREIAARPKAKLSRWGNTAIAASAVAVSTALTAILALTTAIRPHPWWDPHYAIPLTGIILGSVLNSASLALDAVLRAAQQQRAAIEARLALGTPYNQAIRPIVQDAARIGLLPVVNQMSAAGIITLPGIMTGQILAGMDPMDAVKYQILLMFLLAGSSGLAAVLTAILAARRLTDGRDRLRLDQLRR